MASTEATSIFTVLVTGANSGLGLATCRRLIDEFLETRPASQSLLLIPTTRSTNKSQQTLETLSQYVVSTAHNADKKKPGQDIAQQYEARIRIRPEQVDLNSLRSVRELGRKLNSADGVKKLDVIICNAGIGGWTGIDWPRAIYLVLTDLVHAVTWPTYKKAGTGVLAKSQLPERVTADTSLAKIGNETQRAGKEEESQLGEVFTANVFGHYMLAHDLMPVLKRGGDSNTAGRIIWLSSLEAYDWAFDADNDLQGLKTSLAYESSKRLTDVLALTSHLSSTSPFVDAYTSTPQAQDKAKRPRMYTIHPGIAGTSILPLPTLLTWAMLAAFYLARWLGSIWHTIDPYTGSVAPVWMTLVSQEILDSYEKAPPPRNADEAGKSVEERRAVGKWGSATDAEGHERVEKTEVAGWGWSGRVGESSVRRQRGRMRHAKDLTVEDRERFEETGREVWGRMEELRRAWTERLDDAGL